VLGIGGIRIDAIPAGLAVQVKAPTGTRTRALLAAARMVAVVAAPDSGTSRSAVDPAVACGRSESMVENDLNRLHQGGGLKPPETRIGLPPRDKLTVLSVTPAAPTSLQQRRIGQAPR